MTSPQDTGSPLGQYAIVEYHNRITVTVVPSHLLTASEELQRGQRGFQPSRNLIRHFIGHGIAFSLRTDLKISIAYHDILLLHDVEGVSMNPHTILRVVEHVV